MLKSRGAARLNKKSVQPHEGLSPMGEINGINTFSPLFCLPVSFLEMIPPPASAQLAGCEPALVTTQACYFAIVNCLGMSTLFQAGKFPKRFGFRSKTNCQKWYKSCICRFHVDPMPSASGVSSAKGRGNFWYAGRPACWENFLEVLICSICQFLWYIYSCHDQFQANDRFTTGSQNSWLFDSQLCGAHVS